MFGEHRTVSLDRGEEISTVKERKVMEEKAVVTTKNGENNVLIFNR